MSKKLKRGTHGWYDPFTKTGMLVVALVSPDADASGIMLASRATDVKGMTVM